MYPRFGISAFGINEFHVDNIGLFSEREILAETENYELYKLSYDLTCNFIVGGIEKVLEVIVGISWDLLVLTYLHGLFMV